MSLNNLDYLEQATNNLSDNERRSVDAHFVGLAASIYDEATFQRNVKHAVERATAIRCAHCCSVITGDGYLRVGYANPLCGECHTRTVLAESYAD